MNKSTMSEQQLRAMNFGEIMDRRYRSENPDVVEAVTARVKRKVSRWSRPTVTVYAAFLAAIALPLMIFIGFMIGIAVTVEIITDTFKMWFGS